MQLNDDAVLLKSLYRVCATLELELASISALSSIEPFSNNCAKAPGGAYALPDTARKNVLMVIRIYQALIALTGSAAFARAWLRSHNTALGDCPLALLATTPGLLRVLDYLEASV